MDRIPSLVQQLSDLQAAAVQIRSEGEVLQGVRIERSPGGGTASQAAKAACKYARLRAGRGKMLPNGKKSQYIAQTDIAKYEVMIARGQQLSQIEKQIAQVQRQLDKALALARALGLIQ